MPAAACFAPALPAQRHDPNRFGTRSDFMNFIAGHETSGASSKRPHEFRASTRVPRAARAKGGSGCRSGRTDNTDDQNKRREKRRSNSQNIPKFKTKTDQRPLNRPYRPLLAGVVAVRPMPKSGCPSVERVWEGRHLAVISFYKYKLLQDFGESTS